MFPWHDDLEPGIAKRLDRMLAAEGEDRLRAATISVTVASLFIAPLLVLLAGLPEAFYYHALLVVFIALVWLQYLCSKRWPQRDWIDYTFAAINAALLSFTLAFPNPFAAPEALAAPLTMSSNIFIFFFLIPVTLAFSFSPGLVLWSGLCCAVFWTLIRYWVVFHHGTGPIDAGSANIAFLIQDIAVLLMVSAILAAVVHGSHTLLIRRAIEERRGANLSRYLPQQMAERMAEADEPFLQDRDVEAAVLFTDIVGFTRWAESHSPGEVLALLRRVHALVAEEVFKANGVLDKFIGDGAMATFGVAQQRDVADRALDCAEAILRRTAALNRERAADGHRPVRLSVGVHYGSVTVGDVGTADRMEMAVIGDSVNVASRVEALTRKLECGAAASDAIMQMATKSRSDWRERGEQILPGRKGGITIWSRDLDTDDPARTEMDDGRAKLVSNT